MYRANILLLFYSEPVFLYMVRGTKINEPKRVDVMEKKNSSKYSCVQNIRVNVKVRQSTSNEAIIFTSNTLQHGMLWYRITSIAIHVRTGIIHAKRSLIKEYNTNKYIIFYWLWSVVFHLVSFMVEFLQNVVREYFHPYLEQIFSEYFPQFYIIVFLFSLVITS